MNDTRYRTLPDKKRPSVAFHKQSKVADKKNCPSNRTTVDISPSMHYGKTCSHIKIKRLRSHRQRNQLRGCVKKGFKSNHHRCQHSASTDIAHLPVCCQSRCCCPFRKVAPLPQCVPAAQEPSIITDNRLIGHQGLFNHEVKSVDIDRLLSGQRELDKDKRESPKKKHVSSHHLSASLMPSPFCSNPSSEANDPLPRAKKTVAVEKSPDIYVKGAEKSVHTSDSHVTPAQRPRQRLGPPSRGGKGTVSSKHTHSSLSDVVFNSTRTQADLSKRARVSSTEDTPENPQSPVSNRRVHRHSSKPATPSSPQTPETFEFHQRQQEPDWVSQSIEKVAACLCDGLCFPKLRQRDLVAESREVLLKALYKTHGPHLQGKLLQLQQCFGFDSDPASEVQDREMSSTDTDELLLPATAGPQPNFYANQSASFTNTGSSQNANPQPQHNTKPVWTPFGPAGAVAVDDFFAPSATSDWAEAASTSQHWEDPFNRPKTREDLFGPFKNPFLSANSPRRSHLHNNPFYLHDRSPSQLRSQPSDMANYPPSHMLERDSGHSLFSFPGPEHWSFPPMRLF